MRPVAAIIELASAIALVGNTHNDLRLAVDTLFGELSSLYTLPGAEVSDKRMRQAVFLYVGSQLAAIWHGRRESGYVAHVRAALQIRIYPLRKELDVANVRRSNTACPGLDLQDLGKQQAPQKKRRPSAQRSMGSEAAAQAVDYYLARNALNRTNFATRIGCSDRTLPIFDPHQPAAERVLATSSS